MNLFNLSIDIVNALTLAQADGAGPAAGDAAPDPVNPLGPLIPMLAIGVFFYFIMMRPQQKEAKKRKELLNQLKKNDKIVTIGGIIGTIVDLNTDRVTVRVDDGTRIKFVRSSIQGVYDENAESESAK